MSSSSSSFELNFSQLQGKWVQFACTPLPIQADAKNIMVECLISKQGQMAEIKTVFDEPGLLYGESKSTSFASALVRKDFQQDPNVKFSFHARPEDPPSSYTLSVKDFARQKLVNTMFRMSGISKKKSNYVVTGMGEDWFTLSYVNKKYAFIFVRTLDQVRLSQIAQEAHQCLEAFGVDTSVMEKVEMTGEFYETMKVEFEMHRKQIQQKTACSCSCGCHLVF